MVKNEDISVIYHDGLSKAKVAPGANPPPYNPHQQQQYPVQAAFPAQGIPPIPVPRIPTNMSDYNSFGEDERGGSSFSFSDASIRKGFIRKVFAILMCQLLVSLGFISLFVYNEGVRQWTLRNSYLVWVAFAIVMVTMLTLACCDGMRRKFPWNFILLGLFTVAESFMLGTVSATYKADEVVLAVGICAAVCLALTIFAMQTKVDFTALGGILLCCTVVLFIFGIVAIFIPGNTVRLVYASLGALLFSVYLVFDVQLMMGGKHKYSISPEEYIFAALNLYVDIVNIFMFILSIIGNSRN
ncbi:protein lifeguard 1-like isoform X1 [Artemia franciscana]